MKLIYKSESYTGPTSNGSTRQFGGSGQRPDFIPATGPKGGRVIVDKLVIVAVMSLTTDGSTSIKGASQYTAAIKRFRVTDIDDTVLVDCKGDELRLLMLAEMGRDAVADPSDLAISQTGAARTIRCPIIFSPRKRAKRGRDFCLPADRIKKLELQVPAISDITMTGSGLTFAAGTQYQIHAVCHEVPFKSGLEFNTKLIRKSVDVDNVTSPHIPLFGEYPRTVLGWKPSDTASGGTASTLANVAEFDCPALGLNLIDTGVLAEEVRLQGDHDRSSTTDPFVTGNVMPFVVADRDQKQKELMTHGGQPLARITSGSGLPSSSVLVMETLLPFDVKRTKGMEGRAARKGNTQTSKTAGKTMKAPGAHGEHEHVLPRKIHPKNAAAR